MNQRQRQLLRLLSLEVELLRLKHGKHNQASHGRKGGRGSGTGGTRSGAEPSENARLIQNIDAELASSYTSPGRRQFLEERRGVLVMATPSADTTRKLRDIDAELASPYTSPGRRQFLEERRQALGAPATSNVAHTPKGLRAEVDATEAQIRTMRVERAVFFDARGNRLADVTGDKNSYRLSEKEFDALRGAGATMTHNHPGGWDHAPNNPRHQGSSFSLADIRQAAALNLAEVRAVTPTRRFWMKPPMGGWKEDHWQTTIPKAYKRHDSAVLADLVQQVRVGRLTADEANARHYHEVWTRVARDIGASYGYEDR